jgi:glycosyltransferase involved in cell wall biosynthesis
MVGGESYGIYMTTNPRDHKIPKVSIGLPVYNGEKFIQKALDSLLEQTFTEFELIISDNASDDRTEFICREYAERDSRIRYIRQIKNMGAAANWHRVLDYALGELFIWFAHDDACHPKMLSLFIAKMDLDPNIVLCISDIICIDDNDNIIIVEKLTNLYDGSNWHKTRKVFYEFPCSNIFFALYGLYRTNVLRSVGGPIPTSRHYYSHCEVPFLAKLSLTGKIFALPLPLKYYRVHNDSLYNKEIETIPRAHYLRIRLNIRRDLIKIINSSHLPALEKLCLMHSVLFSWLKDILKICYEFVFRYFI